MGDKKHLFTCKKRIIRCGLLVSANYLCAMEILDGQLVSQATRDELKIKVAELIVEGKKIPHLAAVLVGNNGASETYVGAKVKACEEIGYKSTLTRLESTISENSYYRL